MKTERAENPKRPVRIPPPRMADTPDGTAEATKQNLEAQPHPSKKTDVSQSHAPQHPQGHAPQGQGQAPNQGPKDERDGLDFVRRIIEEDNRTGKWGGRVATRFPPEPY